jgi:anti-sigma factor RsiW
VTISRQDELLLNAYLDGELDAMEADSFERRLASEPGLAAGIEARRTLRAALRAGLADDVPSPDLRRRILASLAPAAPRASASWRALAASFVMGAVLAGSLSLATLPHRGDEAVADAVVSNHIRALMAPQPIDFPSTEHHTVKPWFNGKVPFAPAVPDLSARDFPLMGARLDVVALKPAATLVYAYGKHLISVTAMPSAEGAEPSVASKVERGYLAISWTEGGVTYWAVSDAAPQELERFVKLFRAEAAHP